jgi:hypothetical protein
MSADIFNSNTSRFRRLVTDWSLDMTPDMTKYKMPLGACVSLNSVHREILSSFTIDSYDKVRGPNKAQ